MMQRRGRWSRWRWATDRGAIAPAAAIILAVLLGMAALTTDVGLGFSRKRDLQAATDAAALAAVSNGAALTANQLPQLRGAAEDFLVRNGYGTANLEAISTGTYCADRDMAAGARFRTAIALCPGDTRRPADAVANAVRVQTQTDSPLLLSRVLRPPGTDDYIVTASATATRIDEAGFQAGTGLLAVDTTKSAILNAILGGLLGTNINLTAADYNGLINTDIQALAFLDALNTRLSVHAGTYGELLQTRVGVGALIQAAIDALQKQGQVAQVVINGLLTLQGKITGNPELKLGDLLDLGVWRKQPIGGSMPPTALQAGLNALQLVTLALQVANGRNAVAIPELHLGVVGIVSVDVTATVIEPPRSPPFAFGPVGISVHTAQVRLALKLKVLEAVNWLLGITVPLYIEVASGDAYLAGIQCGPGVPGGPIVTIRGRSAVANVYIGKVYPPNAMTNFDKEVRVEPATLTEGLLTALIRIDARAKVSVGTPSNGGDWRSYPALDFKKTDIDAKLSKRFTSTNMIRNLLSELVGSLDIQAYLILGLIPINLSGDQLRDLSGLLSTVLGGLLDSILDPLIQALGIQLGYMDIRVTGVRCGVPVLVQ